QRTPPFSDDNPRSTKAQQHALLPHEERGTLTLVGATTENPSFEVNSALLSRCRVLTVRPLGEEEVATLVRRALADERGLAGKVTIEDAAIAHLAQAAYGDARRALSALEVAAAHAGGGAVKVEHVEEALQAKTLLYDKAGEEHYNVISAFIKSMRGSDPDAAVYYMVRMLESGEDPLFIVRRMVIFAGEDIGNADPQALAVTVNCLQAVQFVGLPEAVLPMSAAASYLALAPKSNAALKAYSAARQAVMDKGPVAVPMHVRNAPTTMMKKMGYGAGYKYPHNFEGHYVAEEYLPEELKGARFYEPSGNGFESELKERLERIRAARRQGKDG
ncbi:MAG: replication-associated recombination protein A, partial [Deltaproteobacteria bacterium]|nr:replication-associated recombination protein A [Deltaproteobacteria bacterium]